MFAARTAPSVARRAFSTSAANLSKVAVLGAGGGIGQPLSLLLKLNKDVTDLRLYDIRGAPGVGADLSHIDTPAHVKGFAQEDLKGALTGAEIVVIPAGVPRKPGMTRDDLFNTNASIVRDLAQGIADFCPKAAVLIISNPVNSTVPIAAEVFKKAGTFDPKKLFGVTTLDVVRSSTFVAQVTNTTDKVADYVIPVIGGHSGVTIIPLLSQAKPAVPDSVTGDKATLDALVNRIQFGGDEVVKAKDGAGSATLSMAQAGAKFASLVLRAMYKGEKGLVSPSFVSLEADQASGSALREELGKKDLAFFSSNIELGPEGVAKIQPVGKVTEAEQKLIEACLPELEKNIAKGVSFMKA